MTTPTNLPAAGHVGVEPPADAPREVAQPLTAEAITRMQANARANERELAPLRAPGTPLPVDDGRVQPASHEVQAPEPVKAAPGYKQVAPRADEFPAGSNTDTPKRGLPGTAPVPAGRKYAPLNVTGGFGESEGEYYPLDGGEALELAKELIAGLYARIQDDIRFTRAQVYPRLSMTVQLIVEGEADDQVMKIEKIMPPHDKTPLEVAKSRGDSVVFVVKEQRREFNDAGEVETPADAMRDELGLKRPGKRQIGSGQNKSLVDVTW